MALNLLDVQHASMLVNAEKRAVIAFETFRSYLNDFKALATRHNFSGALTAPAASFPPNYTLTPAEANSALTSMTSLKSILDTNVTNQVQANLDAVRLNVYP